MLDKLNSVEASYEELMALLATPSVQSDSNEYRKHAKALAEIQPLVEKAREYKTVLKEIAQAEELVKSGDADMRELAEEELAASKQRRDALLAEIKLLLIPKDPNDQKNVMLEIRAGTGGDEAALFAYELFRMYSKFAEKQGWRVEVMSTSESDVGGVKEVIATIEGRGAYSKLKYESGVHRVQRVPATEASGPHPYVDGDGGGAARSRGGRRADRSRRTCASTRSARAAPAARASTRPTRPSASRTSRPTPSSRSRTRNRRSRTGRRRCACSARGSTRWRCASSRTRSPRIAAARSAPASARRRSARITSRKTVSPTTACRVHDPPPHRSTERGDLTELLDNVSMHYQTEKLKEATRRIMTIHDLVQGARDRFVHAGISADSRGARRRGAGAPGARLGSRAFSHRSRRERDQHVSPSATSRSSPAASAANRCPTSSARASSGASTFEVGPDVLIPRHETEFIVEETLALAGKRRSPADRRRRHRQRLHRHLAGSGDSGGARHRDRRVRHALEVARRNAARHDVADRITFVETSFLDGIEGPVDIIVSNPPYVPSVSEPGLTPEVRDYEPRVALFGGEDGLEGLRSVLEGAATTTGARRDGSSWSSAAARTIA